MRHETFSLTTCGTCRARHRPCLVGLAFLERLGQSFSLVRRSTGAAPQMQGEVTFTQCPALDACALHWRTCAGALELGTEGRVLLRGKLVAEVVH